MPRISELIVITRAEHTCTHAHIHTHTHLNALSFNCSAIVLNALYIASCSKPVGVLWVEVLC